jgi:ABC-type cobalt transport system substrate-binding protein
MMETLIYSICIAICGYVIGHVIGYRRGHDDMDKVYKEVYNIKEY